MKKIMVQIWALSLLLLHVSCTPASQTIATYTLTQSTTPNEWNLDVYANSYNNTLAGWAVSGPWPDSVVTNNIPTATLFKALNATLDQTANFVRVVFRTDNKGHYADFYNGNTLIGTYTLLNVPNKPNHNTALAWLDFNFGSNIYANIDVYSIAQQNGTIYIRLHTQQNPPKVTLIQQYTGGVSYIHIYLNNRVLTDFSITNITFPNGKSIDSLGVKNQMAANQEISIDLTVDALHALWIETTVCPKFTLIANTNFTLPLFINNEEIVQIPFYNAEANNLPFCYVYIYPGTQS